uniref:HhH-GPD domain-containing protein n=1 Tax=Kalanchoe fedtschenkoi TaxID=63787 RepID=A0A7N0VFD2_KALFE
MEKPQKRRKRTTPCSPSSSAKSAAVDGGGEPYPFHSSPTSEECWSVRGDLLALHGFPQQFVKYRNLRRELPPLEPKASRVEVNEVECCGNGLIDKCADDETERESVLDGLVSIMLSQNTTDANARKAFVSLKSAFPEWEHVLAAESKSIENAIRCGGLAVTKAAAIKNLLSLLLEKRGRLCLEYLHGLSIDEVKAELSQFKGIGPKTIACVLMFNLQLDDFPVDTHIFQISKAIGWVPENADVKKTYLHLNRRMPNELKFDLNCLLFTHGKLCNKCSGRGGRLPKKVEAGETSCPLLKYIKDDNKKRLLDQ